MSVGAKATERMTVVSDSTCVTTLMKAGEVWLLKELFTSVLVPPAVAGELRAFHEELPDFVVVHPVQSPELRLPGTETLGRGEAEAIKLAKQLRADLLLTDDRKARLLARKVGVECSGLLGLLVQAKRKGMLPSVKQIIEVLECRGSLYLSDAIKAEVLKLAGE